MSVAPASRLRVGTAGWSLPKQYAESFPAKGSHLERYAARFNAVEINSSFYRPHRRSTYERWAASVPTAFAFSVKLSREITHDLRLEDAAAPLDAFLAQAEGLGAKLAVVLVQLPPSAAFERKTVTTFCKMLRKRFAGGVALEPRHPSWFDADVDALLCDHRLARVAADPSIVPAAAKPGGWPGLRYFRLHGAPRTYYSDYAPEAIARYAAEVRRGGSPTWCIFDNTALGAATANALALRDAVMR